MRDTEIEWFRPLWLRIVVTAAIAIWFGYEIFFSHDQLWILVTGAALAYAVWNLFIKFNGRVAEKDKAAGTDGDGKPKA